MAQTFLTSQAQAPRSGGDCRETDAILVRQLWVQIMELRTIGPVAEIVREPETAGERPQSHLSSVRICTEMCLQNKNTHEQIHEVSNERIRIIELNDTLEYLFFDNAGMRGGKVTEFFLAKHEQVSTDMPRLYQQPGWYVPIF